MCTLRPLGGPGEATEISYMDHHRCPGFDGFLLYHDGA